jgi:hypothetical protein
MLNIEILYVTGCPNHGPALGRLRTVLQSEAIDVPINEIAVNDETTARTLGFPGSPTIRINGVDVETPISGAVGIACRLYKSGHGLPSEETLQRAISLAKTRETTE